MMMMMMIVIMAHFNDEPVRVLHSQNRKDIIVDNDLSLGIQGI